MKSSDIRRLLELGFEEGSPALPSKIQLDWEETTGTPAPKAWVILLLIFSLLPLIFLVGLVLAVNIKDHAHFPD